MNYIKRRAIIDEDSDLIVYKTLTSTYTLPDPTTETDDVSYIEKTTVESIVTRIPVKIKSKLTAPTPVPNTRPTTTTPTAQPTTQTIQSESPTHISPVIPGQNNGTKIGLAIGIPIALFSLFFIGLGVWYYFRKNKSLKNAIVDRFKGDDHTLTNLEKGEGNLRKENPYFSEESSSSIYINPGPQRKVNPDSIRYKWKDRLSRVISGMGNVNDEEQQQQQEVNYNPNFFKRMSMMTPSFLRKFNLQKPDQDIEPQVISMVENTQYKPKKINSLFPNLQIGETLDPVQGGVSPNQDLYLVIRTYVKQLTDELTIKIGDKVVILKSYSDGWCNVRLVRTGRDYYRHIDETTTGLVPKICLQKV
ncbi:hypothetical protein JA1_002471 [Spathaspora sp. JA1]|nr:hypothetical protein JA1_002471 [Spathaspora sp. JA1]